MAEPLSLGQLGRVLLRYWILIVAGTLLGAALAFGATRLMTPVYRATATQLVKGQPGTGSAPSYEAAQYAVSRAKTYPSFVYNAGVLESIQEDLGGLRTVEQLRQDLTASNPVGTPLLEITADGSSPREASEKANSAAKHLALFITKIETVGTKTPISVELAVQAALPTEAASPKTLVITALGAMIGFALATMAALLNSYIRYQRRSAFRRRQATSWAMGEADISPRPPSAPADPGPVTTAAGVAATVVAATAPGSRVDDGPSDPGPTKAKEGSAPSVESVPDGQPALVESHDTEPVTTVVQTKAAPSPDRPMSDAAGPGPRSEASDLDDTVALSVFDPPAGSPVPHPSVAATDESAGPDSNGKAPSDRVEAEVGEEPGEPADKIATDVAGNGLGEPAAKEPVSP